MTLSHDDEADAWARRMHKRKLHEIELQELEDMCREEELIAELEAWELVELPPVETDDTTKGE